MKSQATNEQPSAMEKKKEPIHFDTTPGAPGRAHFCVVLACLAYKTQKEIEQELVEYGYNGTNVLFFATNLTSGFIIVWDDVVAVAFKGTTTWREWLNNANVYLKRIPDGRVHAGFYNSIKTLGPELLTIVKPTLDGGSKLVVTGHSRGGAIALLFVTVAAHYGISVHAVHTFGSPAVGDAEFANYWRSESNQYKNTHRWIPSFILFPITLATSAGSLFWVAAIIPLKLRAWRFVQRLFQ